MPSLNTKRKVTYSAADERCIESALTIAMFAREFDQDVTPVTVDKIDALLKHIQNSRKPKAKESAK